jgi:hypothetical protein
MKFTCVERKTYRMILRIKKLVLVEPKLHLRMMLTSKDLIAIV